MTPSCIEDDRQVLLIVPQISRSCTVSIASPFNVTNIQLVKGLSRRLEVACAKPNWNSLGEIGGQIRSNCEISVYVEDRGDNYLVHPLDVAGNKYTVVVPTELSADWECITIIYPVHNTTNITIISDATTSGSFLFDNSSWSRYNSKYKMMVTLHQFEAIYIKCTCGLSGVEVSSPKPFMVVVGALRNTRNPFVLVEQLPPESTWGRQFMFPVPTLLSMKITLYLTGKNNTADILIKTNTTEDIVSITSFPYTQLIEADGYIYIESLNSSILPMVLMDAQDSKKPQRLTFMTIPPRSQCLPRQVFNDEDAVQTVLSVWGTYGYNLFINSENLTTAGQVTNSTPDDMYLYLNIQIYNNFTIAPKKHKTLFPSVCGLVENSRITGAIHLYSMGMRQTNVFDSCVTSDKRTFSADGIDNDCDGLVDEELRNRRDDDGDGLIDEDIGTWVDPRRKINIESGFVMETSVVAVIISIVVALVAVIAFIGGMLVADQLMGGNAVAPVLESPDLQ
ncbi:uncharacterized protein [Argopecten irradians]|uniref:uncharacterized protein n=1 Tax=Argopecten irradians TaxID=31199 RepID=UPI003711416B